MDAIAGIEMRFGMRLPPLYRTLLERKHFDHKHEESHLSFSDHEWLTLEQIAKYQFLSWQASHKSWMVPFAISARRDEWGWRTDWLAGDEPPVVYCEHGDAGYGYAPNFAGYLYRRLLEEFSGSSLLESPDDERGRHELERSVHIVLPHLPGPWVKHIKTLSSKPWHREKNGALAVISRKDCDALVADELAFPHLNEKFLQGPAR
jgi:hypothetical protein